MQTSPQKCIESSRPMLIAIQLQKVERLEQISLHAGDGPDKLLLDLMSLNDRLAHYIWSKGALMMLLKEIADFLRIAKISPHAIKSVAKVFNYLPTLKSISTVCERQCTKASLVSDIFRDDGILN